MTGSVSYRILFFIFVNGSFNMAQGSTWRELSVIEPCFVGRNIIFRLSYVLGMTEPKSLRMYALFPNGKMFNEIKIDRATVVGAELHMQVNSVNKTWDNAVVYVKDGFNVSSTFQLRLKEFDNKCGHLFIQSYPNHIGDSAQIDFYPSHIVLNNPKSRVWLRDRVSIELEKGKYEEVFEKERQIFSFVAFNFTKKHTYSLTCKHREEGNTQFNTTDGYVEKSDNVESTNAVSLFIGKPALGPMCMTEHVSSCVCVAVGDTIDCKTYSSNSSLHIGDEHEFVPRRLSSLYDETYVLMKKINDSSYHKRTVLCFATFGHESYVFNTSAAICIIEPPRKLYLYAPVVTEDEPANISCVAYDARPAPKLEIYIGDDNILDVNTSHVYDATLDLYDTVLEVVRSANKSWNNKVIHCKALVYEPIKGTYVQSDSRQAIFEYKYPPHSLKMTSQQRPIMYYSLHSFHVCCEMDETNAECKIEWSTKIQNATLERIRFGRLQGGQDCINAILPREANGQSIRCAVICSDVRVDLHQHFIVDLPRNPVVNVHKTNFYNSNSQSEMIILICEVVSNPVANISWISENGNKEYAVCTLTSECVIQINASVVERQNTFECVAVNIYGESRNSITVAASDTFTTVTALTLPWMYIAAGLGAVVILGCLVIAIVVGMKRVSKPKRKHPLNKVGDQDAMVLNDIPDHSYRPAEYDEIDDPLSTLQAEVFVETRSHPVLKTYEDLRRSSSDKTEQYTSVK
ncbi:uncharacterized protein LOC127877872 isoform X2 [Dreissena polymorpha]|uniref:uncharacterized protein LOC127877872 isoform X2 n=1 Tax=Dreissena polymorpha TaxID=45954 RepID=UPI002263E813|nr:uncharacterized protein LOC127877872 isoform X2 [Dreissena polymorpha]